MEDSLKQEYYELLKFESVGADPAKLKECASCAVWLKKWLEAIDFDCELLMGDIKDGKASPPVLYAERSGCEGSPTVLIYGHYDVQPADPISEWKTPPFTPTEIDGRVY
ncbi:MAG: M20/M25/M40 family metallo-hydrolase, partial [Kiritimatiellae bacterium]|nr:M20/M25/M40 family metallo-hydrolase [Kiritimatiellia bacterium]